MKHQIDSLHEQNAIEQSKLRGEIASFVKDVEKKLIEIQTHIVSTAQPPQSTHTNQQTNYEKMFYESQEQNIKRLERIVELQNNIILAAITTAKPPPQHPASTTNATTPPVTEQRTQLQINTPVTPSTQQYPMPPQTTTAPPPPQIQTPMISRPETTATNITSHVIAQPPASQQHRERHPTNENRKSRVTMVGDSMLGGVKAEHSRLKPTGGLSRRHYIDIGAHGGRTTEDMIDLIKPVLRHNPDKIIVMSGTNDFQYGIDTISHARQLIRNVREAAPNVKLALTEICMRRDNRAPPHSHIADVNNRLRQLCRHEQVELISMNTFDGRCLSNGKLHPNEIGNDVLRDLFVNFMNK